MPRPRIGITCEMDIRGNRPRYELPVAYAASVERAGGVPVLLPAAPTWTSARRLLPPLGGLIFSGGDDLDPVRYGEGPHPKTRRVPTEKESADLRLLTAALATGVPLLGICYGCQLLNVARGGSLIQDLPSMRPRTLRHRAGRDRKRIFHPVRVEPGSLLHRVLRRPRLTANSAHHQAVRTFGRGLRAVAWAPDGIIEGIEDPSRAFVLGVQWHPERLMDRAVHLRLFQALVRAARRRTRR
jgi:putative glutamine amidotransferase